VGKRDKIEKTAAIIQARLGSSRLPGKVLMCLNGKSILEIMIERIKRSREIDAVIIATSACEENDAIQYVADQHNIPCFRGSEKDVLDRYYNAASLYGADHIVRLTADCPLIEPEIIDSIIQKYHEDDADIALSSGFPDGLDVSIFSFKSLKSAWEKAELPSEREHVVPWILKQCSPNGLNLFKAVYYECNENLSNLRWTIDEAKDYIFLKTLYPSRKYTKIHKEVV